MENGYAYADGISRIEINSLWGRKHIVWNLRPDVNILSGVNGTGKSTILNKTVSRLDYLLGDGKEESQEVSIDFYPQGAQKLRYDVIRSIDRPLMHSNLLEKMSDKSVVSELDWQLYKLQRRYLDYQVNIGNRTIQLLTSGNPDNIKVAQEISAPRIKFMDYMDEPEISLHIEWQQQLIQRVRSLNPNVQIIMTTHSPALIMDGWMDAVTDVEDITVK